MSNQIHDPMSGAIQAILLPLTKGEGLRHLWLGDSRMGKTYANDKLVKLIQKKKLVDMILTVDEKDPYKPQYRGYYCINPEHLRANPPSTKEEASHIVFRGLCYRRDFADSINPADVAQMARELILQNPTKILINLDELADATNSYQGWNDDIIPQIYRKGGGIGLSMDATTQLPQLLPREAFGLSETIGIFRMDGREAAYLVKYRVATEEMASIIPSLEVGHWILFRKGGGGWDGKIYKF